MFLAQVPAKARDLQPVTIYTHLQQTAPPGKQSVAFLISNPRQLDAVEYRRVGGQTFNVGFRLEGRLTQSGAWTPLMSVANVSNPYTPRTQVLIDDELRKQYVEYLLVVESAATVSSILMLEIKLIQLAGV